MAGTAIGAAALAAPKLALAERLAGGVSGPESQVGRIYQLQAAFHRAKTTQDLDLMMSLWADDATFTNKSTGTTYAGFDQIKSFWQGSGSVRGNEREAMVRELGLAVEGAFRHTRAGERPQRTCTSRRAESSRRSWGSGDRGLA